MEFPDALHWWQLRRNENERTPGRQIRTQAPNKKKLPIVEEKRGSYQQMIREKKKKHFFTGRVEFMDLYETQSNEHTPRSRTPFTLEKQLTDI